MKYITKLNDKEFILELINKKDYERVYRVFNGIEWEEYDDFGEAYDNYRYVIKEYVDKLEEYID